MTQPKVSVVLPVHNGERFLSLAIESVLTQTLEDFELIVIDDGSDDSTPALLSWFAALDKRLRVQRNPSRLGVSASLNRGIALAKAALIARMDADDICVPRRMELQSAFLDAHPAIGVLGSAVEFIDERGRPFGVLEFPLSPLAVQWRSFISAPFVHPSVMLRKALLTTHGIFYREEYDAVQDADLWSRLLFKTQGANLKQPLLRYRVHAGSVTKVTDKTRVRKLRTIERTKQIRAHFPDIQLTDEDLAIMYSGFLRQSAPSDQRARSALHYLVLWEAFGRTLPPSTEKQELQREVISTALKFAFYPALQSESWTVLKALFALDRTWPIGQVPEISKLIYQRVLSLRARRKRFAR